MDDGARNVRDDAVSAGGGSGFAALVGGVAVGWGVLRVVLNREFRDATWSELLRLDAVLPFGHRVLVPLLARPLVAVGLTIPQAWIVFETMAMAALVAVLVRVLSTRVDPRPARLLALAFPFVLVLPFLLPHRWPIFYPWDTPAMAFTAAGVAIALAGRYPAGVALTAVGALNRESAVLIPAIFVVLSLHDPQRRRRAWAWAGLMLVAFFVVRWGIAAALPDNRGAPLRLYVSGHLRVLHNLDWIASPRHAVVFVASLGFLPLLWPALRRFIPADLDRLHLLVLATFAGLTFVANVYEPRAFGEILTLAWIAVAIGVGHWLRDTPPDRPERPRWLALIDRFGALTIALGWAATVYATWRWLAA